MQKIMIKKFKNKELRLFFHQKGLRLNSKFIKRKKKMKKIQILKIKKIGD